MNNQLSESETLNSTDGYISWDSNTPSLDNESFSEPSNVTDEFHYDTPLSLFQSVSILAVMATNILVPLDDHHVNHITDQLLLANFNSTLNNIVNNLPNTQGNLEELFQAQILLCWMYQYNLSLGQDRHNFLCNYTS